jgi:hypothetical protein
MKKYTTLPLYLERIMLKLLDGATFKHDTIEKRYRIEIFLSFVTDALGDGNPLDAQRKWRSIMSKLERFERATARKRNE